MYHDRKLTSGDDSVHVGFPIHWRRVSLGRPDAYFQTPLGHARFPRPLDTLLPYSRGL